MFKKSAKKFYRSTSDITTTAPAATANRVKIVVEALGVDRADTVPLDPLDGKKDDTGGT